jgi:MOSC domain-containing protein YiiM
MPQRAALTPGAGFGIIQPCALRTRRGAGGRTLSISIDTLYAGRPQPLRPRGAPSAIFKSPLQGPWTVRRTGLAGDEQGDKVHHGGPEKALHHYARDHYAAWAADLPEIAPYLSAAPAFGENISTLGMTEDTVHVGDVFRAGGVVLQVAQGRQPCWKLNAKFGRTDMAYLTQKTGRTGWYYRVLEEGTIAPGDMLETIDRPQPDWPLSRVIGLLYDRTLAFDELAALSEIPELARGWRELAANRVRSRTVESWTPRLTGEA